jgi:hypothetical protein
MGQPEASRRRKILIVYHDCHDCHDEIHHGIPPQHMSRIEAERSGDLDREQSQHRAPGLLSMKTSW